MRGRRISKMVSLDLFAHQSFSSTPLEVTAIIFLAPISAFDQVLTEVCLSVCVPLIALTLTFDV
jgi:hypothetical protein